MAGGIHGLPKVLLGPAMPYYSTPYKRPPPIQPYGHLRGVRPKGAQPAAILLPPYIPHAAMPYAPAWNKGQSDLNTNEALARWRGPCTVA
jgi:hypothetical protein